MQPRTIKSQDRYAMDLPTKKSRQFTPDVAPARKWRLNPVGSGMREVKWTRVVNDRNAPLAQGSYFVASGYESAVYNPVLQPVWRLATR